MQASFAESLDEKIDSLASSPAVSTPAPAVHRAPPRPPAALARAKNSAPPSGDIFAEIRARAQQRGGNAASANRSPVPASSSSESRPPLPPLPGTPKAQPPLPPKPAAATATAAPLKAPAAGIVPPSPKPPALSAVDAAVPNAAQKSRAALEQLVRSLLLAQQIDERSVAQLTRAAVTELKQLAALRVAAMPFESSRLQDLCSTLVNTIKVFLLERRNGGDKASLEKARAALANTLEAIRKLSSELAA